MKISIQNGFPTLITGDIVLTHSDKLLGKLIRFVEKLEAPDQIAKYNHALIMVDATNTFESVAHISSHEFYKEYPNQQVLVLRPKYKYETTDQPLDPQNMINTIVALRKKYEGKIYPFWRLPFFLPGLSWISKRFDLSGYPVCSELAAMFLWKIGARHEHWKGTNPENLEYEGTNWKNIDVIYEGKVPNL